MIAKLNHTLRTIALMLLVVVVVWGINGVYLSALSAKSTMVFWAADFLQWIVLPGVMAWQLAQRHGVYPADYGFTPRWPEWRLLGWAVVALCTLYPAYFVVSQWASQWLGVSDGFFVWQDTFPHNFLKPVLLVYSAVTAGFVESALFIGLPWLAWQRLGAARPVVFSIMVSLVFAAAHWEQGLHVILGALAFNLVACGWYFALKSLWPVVLAHIGVDLVDFIG